MKRLLRYFILFSVPTFFFADASAAASDCLKDEVKVSMSNFVSGVVAILTGRDHLYDAYVEDIIQFLSFGQDDKITVQELVEIYRANSTYIHRAPKKCEFCGTYVQKMRAHQSLPKCKARRAALTVKGLV
jgi:hypothetical protein